MKDNQETGVFPSPEHKRGQRFNELCRRKVTLAEWRILLTLAYYGPLTMFDISRMHHLSYPAIHGTKNDLESLKWIRMVREEKSQKNLRKKVYALTWEGLLWVFSKIAKNAGPASSEWNFSRSDVARARSSLDLKKRRDVDLHLQRALAHAIAV